MQFSYAPLASELRKFLSSYERYSLFLSFLALAKFSFICVEVLAKMREKNQTPEVYEDARYEVKQLYPATAKVSKTTQHLFLPGAEDGFHVFFTSKLATSSRLGCFRFGQHGE